MKRSRSGRGAFDLVGRVRTRFGWNRASQPHVERPARRLGRRAQFAAAGTVIIFPALLASFLSDREAGGPATPKVTRVLESVSETPSVPKEKSRKPKGSDAPVAGSLNDESVAISFKRGNRVPVGYIEIPAIDLETKFFDGVVDASVERGPGHWPGTPWPGEAGNSVFAGHRTTYTRPFADLDRLTPGRVIRAQVRNGSRTVYRVTRNVVVPEAEYVDFVLKQPRNKNVRMITLFACTPKGFRTHRIVVQARAISASDEGPGQGEGAMGGKS